VKIVIALLIFFCLVTLNHIEHDVARIANSVVFPHGS